jgi:hypothetical protein
VGEYFDVSEERTALIFRVTDSGSRGCINSAFTYVRNHFDDGSSTSFRNVDALNYYTVQIPKTRPAIYVILLSNTPDPCVTFCGFLNVVVFVFVVRVLLRSVPECFTVSL